MLYMHKRKKDQIVKRQRKYRQLLQLPSRQLNSHQDDPLWHQTPEMGPEALIAILDSKREIKKALRKMIKESKELRRQGTKISKKLTQMT